MSNEALIEQWNNFFTFKINTNDLLAPTESFLTNALLNILMALKIDAGQEVLYSFFTFLNLFHL